MASIRYILVNGIPPIEVSITPAVQPNQTRSALGTYFFSGLADGVYTIRATDVTGCHDEIVVPVNCITTTTSTTCIVDASLNQIACEDWDEGCVGCYNYLLQNTSETETATFYIITCAGASASVNIYPESQLQLCLEACMVYTLDDSAVITRVDDCTPTSTTTSSTTGESTTTTSSTTAELVSTTTITTTLAPQTNYGYLYNWWGAIGDTDGDGVSEKNIANTGWHLPTDAEIITLRSYLDPLGINIANEAGVKMKETGYTYWLNSGDPADEGTNTSNYNGRGAGERTPTTGGFSDEKRTYTTWTSDEGSSSDVARCGRLAYDNTNFSAGRWNANKKAGFSVRLIKDSTDLSDGETGTYLGNNGIIYPTICIGTQEWMSVSLEETKFRDGSDIPYIGNEAEDNATWIAATSAAYCIYPTS